MDKKKYLVTKGRVVNPRNVIPMGESNIITDNVTKENGFVENISETNAGYARRWVDENHL